MTVESYISALIGREGGYSDHPLDAGGATMWGITEAVARAYGYVGSMRDLPRETAIDIYRRRYWTGPKLDEVAVVFPELAEELLDTGVNMGPTVAVRFLQRALNVLNREGRSYPDISADGVIGPVTIAALRRFLEERGEDGRRTIVAMVNAQQSVRYIELAEARPANEAFQFGWQLRRVVEQGRG